MSFFFFQAEDGIRDYKVTGVQTCALPIYFEQVLSGYDVVLNSLGKDTLEKSLKVLKPGGKLISISGPPDAAFAKENGSNWFLQQAMRLLSLGIRKKEIGRASCRERV